MSVQGEDAELSAIRQRKAEELQKSVGGKPIVINDDGFDAFVESNPTVVVDCWAPWCGPCRAMGPIIDELAAKWAGKVVFAKLNTDENQKTAMRFGIMSIPTLLIFRDGQLADQIVGLPPKPTLVKMLSPLAA